MAGRKSSPRFRGEGDRTKCGGGAARSALFYDLSKDGFHILHHVAGKKTEGLDPLRGEPGITPLILDRAVAHIVGIPVDLDRKRGLPAKEIELVRTDGMLAAILKAGRAPSENGPKRHLGRRHLTP